MPVMKTKRPLKTNKKNKKPSKKDNEWFQCYIIAALPLNKSLKNPERVSNSEPFVKIIVAKKLKFLQDGKIGKSLK